MAMKFYFHSTGNPQKVALMLFEADIAHEVVVIEASKGEQHSPEFLKVNPNAKIPAIDDDGVYVFDSAAILLYLAEKSGKFLPSDAHGRGQLLSWLAWSVSGLSVYTGQYIHLRAFAKNSEGTYALRRFEYEAKRHWQVLENRLAQSEFVTGKDYTVADMAMWGYTRMLPMIFGFEAWEQFPSIKRHVDFINARPAVAKVTELSDRVSAAHTPQMDAAAIGHLFAYAQPGDLVFN